MLELLVLLAVQHLREEEASGIGIQMVVGSRAGHGVHLGTICKTLHRLELKGLVRSRLSEVRHEAGGRRRRLYELTPSGAQLIERNVLAILRFYRPAELIRMRGRWRGRVAYLKQAYP